MEPSKQTANNPSKYNKFDFIIYLTKKEDRTREPDKHRNLPFHFWFFHSKSIVLWQENMEKST